jgi:hypothetical protein
VLELLPRGYANSVSRTGFTGFSQWEDRFVIAAKMENARKFRTHSAFEKKPATPIAPLLLHTPVNELHLIEIQALTNSFFLLT